MGWSELEKCFGGDLVIRAWLRWVWENEDGFFGIGQGPSDQQRTQYGDIAGLADWSTAAGEKALGQALNFEEAIVSGDPSKIARVLGPETSAINKQGQQELKTMSEFGTRSGGTGAAAQTVGDTTRSRYDTMVSNLLSGSVSGLASQGNSLLSTGLTAHEGAFDASSVIQKLNANKMNDIFNSIAEIVGMFGGLVGGTAGKVLTGTAGVLQS